MKNWDEHVWIEDIIYCPTQIFYYFTDTSGKYWCAYIRQRGGPVTLELIELTETEDFPVSSEKWHELDTTRKYDIEFGDEEREIMAVEEETLDILRKRFPDVIFPDHPERRTRKLR